MSMDNERLVTATFEKEKSGADDMRFIVQFDSFTYARVGSDTLIPLFARSRGVGNHTLVYEGTRLPDVLWVK